MSKSLHFLAAGIALMGAGGLYGQSVAGATRGAAPTPPLTWTVTPAVVSQYMFRGTRVGGPAFQPTVEMGYGAWTAGVWASVPLDGSVPTVSDPEYDLYGSYTLTVSDAVSVVASAMWYFYPNADPAAGAHNDTFEPSIALNTTVCGVRLTPKLYYDTMLEGATAEFTAAYAVPLQGLGTELIFSATIGTFKWDNVEAKASPAVRNWGDFWSAGVTLPFQVTANSTVIAGVSYHRGRDNFTKQGAAPQQASTAAMSRGVASLAYSVVF